MFWWMWGSGWGWIGGLATAIFWVLVIVFAVLLLRRELPHLRPTNRDSPALRLLEERYARGEITREDFLHRREVLMRASAPIAAPPPPAEPMTPEPSTSEPTTTEPDQPLPDDPPAGV